mmetsp:Transcript_55442/g.62000  ORF Transcript_55442/g.62000 Transcript_55442/m.62000 type:complete len:99 (-) Transcript_55442:182-478(-)
MPLATIPAVNNPTYINRTIMKDFSCTLVSVTEVCKSSNVNRNTPSSISVVSSSESSVAVSNCRIMNLQCFHFFFFFFLLRSMNHFQIGFNGRCVGMFM